MKEFWRKFRRPSLRYAMIADHGDSLTRVLWLVSLVATIGVGIYAITRFLDSDLAQGMMSLIIIGGIRVYIFYLEWGVHNQMEKDHLR